MIWYNIKKLEHKIAENRLADNEVFNYLLIGTVICTAISLLPENHSEHVWLRLAEIVVTILTTVAGLKLTYHTNRKGDNKDYFRRFLALSFVVFIRTAVLVLAITLLSVSVLYGFEITIDPLQEDILYILLLPVVQIMYYLQLNKSFSNVRRLQAQAQNQC